MVVGDDDVSGSTVGLRLYGEERDTRGVPLIEATNRLATMAARPGGRPPIPRSNGLGA
jgi:hypothetical protein